MKSLPRGLNSSQISEVLDDPVSSASESDDERTDVEMDDEERMEFDEPMEDDEQIPVADNEDDDWSDYEDISEALNLPDDSVSEFAETVMHEKIKSEFVRKNVTSPTALDYFQLLWDDEIQQYIVDQINYYADYKHQINKPSLKRSIYASEWKPTTCEEMLRFYANIIQVSHNNAPPPPP